MRHLLLSVMTVMLLAQFALANAGMHQLHLSEHRHDGGQNSHVHLEFELTTTASVTSDESDFSELCLDCQCHGGISMMAANSEGSDGVPASYRSVSVPENFNSLSSDPSFRPPIV